MAEPAQQKKFTGQQSRKPQHKKLARLPKDYKISKRPLLRPAIPSPYSGALNQKVVYVNAKTPFLSAIKRVEKLLQLADKRLVQSATTAAKQGNEQGRRKRKRGAGDEDEILDIAETVERVKRSGKEGKGMGDGVQGAGEEVVLKATGKAIQKCLELGLWFQQRTEYKVRLQSGSVGAIDDIVANEASDELAIGPAGENVAPQKDAMQSAEHATAGAEADGDTDMDDEAQPSLNDHEQDDTLNAGAKSTKRNEGAEDDIPESRIRYASTLEVYVSLQ